MQGSHLIPRDRAIGSDRPGRGRDANDYITLATFLTVTPELLDGLLEDVMRDEDKRGFGVSTRGPC